MYILFHVYLIYQIVLSVKYPHDNLQVVIIYDKLDQMMIYA